VLAESAFTTRAVLTVNLTGRARSAYSKEYQPSSATFESER